MRLESSTQTTSTKRELITKLILARQNEQQASSEVKALERDLKLLMEEDQNKTLTAPVQGTKYRVTYVRGNRISVNSDGLRKALGTKKWNLVTEKKFSKARLEKALDDGKIEATEVSPYVTEVENAPFLRISEVKSEADEA